MKSTFLKSLFIAIGFGSLFSSCKSECYTCSFGQDSYLYCENEFANRDAFEAYIAYLEAYGYTCVGN